MGNNDSTQLLNYILRPSPYPLQVLTDGVISVVADNPGGYSDDPESDYVLVTSIAFDFAPEGNDGGDLTNSNAWTSSATGPSSDWGISVTGLVITFTPPGNDNEIFPKAGLTFTFPGIPVNGTVGTFQLKITETASAPGNPNNPNYPPQNTRARSLPIYPIGKFPQNFELSPLVPSNWFVTPGVPTDLTLSWNGSQANYQLSYPNNIVTTHADGTALAPTDIYPDVSHGDTPLTLYAPTLFVITATYTPRGGNNPVSVDQPATVGINYLQPAVDAFTISPFAIAVVANVPADVTLTWATSNGAGTGPVGFSLVPGFSQAELNVNIGNNLFAEPANAAGVATFKVLQPHQVMLTVTGAPGTTPVTSTLTLLGCQPLTLITSNISNPNDAVVTPDGKFCLLPNSVFDPSSTASLAVVAIANTDPGTWAVGLIGSFDGQGGVAVTPDGRWVISGNNRLALQPVIFSSADGTGPTGGGTLAGPYISEGVGVTPDSKFIFVSTAYPYVFSVNDGADPSQWGVTQLGVSLSPQHMSNPVRVTSDGYYAFFVGTDNPVVVAIAGQPNPGNWAISTIGGVSGSTDVAFTLDGKYAIVGTANGVAVVAISKGTDPSGWAITQIAGPFRPRMGLTLDGKYLLMVSDTQNLPTTPGFWVLGIATNATPNDWPLCQVQGIFSTTGGGNYACISPDGRYFFCNGGSNGVQPVLLVYPAHQ